MALERRVRARLVGLRRVQDKQWLGLQVVPYGFAYEDMSDYVVHFTKPTPTQSEYQNMMIIYGSRRLIPGRTFGLVRDAAPQPESQRAVCFSEIPLHCLARLADRRGRYGIGFSKEFVTRKGTSPVWYLEKESPTLVAVLQLVSNARASVCPANDPIWRLTPFVDAPGEYPSGTYRFEWEREWRHIGQMQFSEHDVSFLILPEELHAAARSFFESVLSENRGPAYLCQYIDPGWDKAKIVSALSPRPLHFGP